MAKITTFLFTILAAQVVLMSAILPSIQSNEAVTSNARQNQVGDSNTLKAFLDKSVEILKEVGESESGDDEAVKEVLRELSNIKTSLSEQNGSDYTTAQVEETVVAALRKLQSSSNAKNILLEMDGAFSKVAFLQKIFSEIRPAIYQTSKEISKQIDIVALLHRDPLRHIYELNVFHHPITKSIFNNYSNHLGAIVNMLPQTDSDVMTKDFRKLVVDLKGAVELFRLVYNHTVYDETERNPNRDEMELELHKRFDGVSDVCWIIAQTLDKLPEAGVRDAIKRCLIQYITVSYNFYFQIEDFLSSASKSRQKN